MVHRRPLSRRLGLWLGFGAALAATALALAPSADAANRRVAIGDFRWEPREVNIDLNEHVTWHFIGPDTSHSITGISPNAIGMDSDPGDQFPDHPVGDSFRQDFVTAGTYEFHCKLHSAVRGTVTVSSDPGDPVTEPDPVPPIAVDLQAPTLSNLRLGRTRFMRKWPTVLHAELDERAVVEAEYYRLRRGRRAAYVGYRQWSGHIGFNRFNRLGGPSPRFRARPGRFRADIRVTDASANTSFAGRLRFTIVKPRPLRRRR